MSRLLVNGVRLGVTVVGSGPAVVAVHGFAGDMSTWAGLVDELKEEYTVLLVDLLGHGASDCPEEPARYSMERSVSDLMALLDHLGVSRAGWLGYSMGGRLALLGATMMPERCACLILEGASPGLAEPKERAERAEGDHALADLIEEKGVEAFFDYWERLPLFASQRDLPREIRAFIREQRLRQNPRGLANTLRGASVGVQSSVRERLPSLVIPVLCIVGEKDAKFRAIGEEMCELLPDGNLSLIPGAGHCAHLERSQEFNRTVLGFLRQQPPWTPPLGAGNPSEESRS